MLINSTTLIVILGMAAVTYATRIAGLWLMNRVTLGKRMTTWLGHIPGAVIISIVAPAVLKGGLAEVLAALITGLVAVRTNNMVLAMLAGVISVAIVRTLATSAEFF